MFCVLTHFSLFIIFKYIKCFLLDVKKRLSEFSTFIGMVGLVFVLAVTLSIIGVVHVDDRAALAAGSAELSSIISESSSDYDGYIVVLETPSVVEELSVEIQEVTIAEQKVEEVVQEIQEAAPAEVVVLREELAELREDKKEIVEELTSLVEEHKEDIKDEQESFKLKVAQTLGEERGRDIIGQPIAFESTEDIQSFDTTINAVVVKDITPEEAQLLEKLPEVKKIYPNYKVQATLMDSVPLIGADQVWKLDADGGMCNDDVNGTNGTNGSGGTCLTGKGIKIGIIDTGVDYTHPDLGGCFGGDTVFACDVDDVLFEGDGATYSVDNLNYEIRVVDMDPGEVVLSVNGEVTPELINGVTYTFTTGATISPTEIIYQDYPGGERSVHFCFNGPQSAGARGDLFGRPVNEYIASDGDCVSMADLTSATGVSDLSAKLAVDYICGDDKQQFYDNVVSIATRRKDLLVDLIKTNPEEALRVAALPQSLADSLPVELVEKRGRFEGILNVLHQDDFDHAQSKFLHYLQLNSFSGDLAGRPVNVLLDTKPIELFSGTELPVQRSGATVSFSGLYVGNVAAVGGNVNILSPPPGSPASENFGNQRTLALVVGIGRNPPPATVDEVRNTLFNPNGDTTQKFYIDNSYGQTQLVGVQNPQGDVLGPYQFDESVCYFDDVMVKALDEAQNTVDVTQYDRIILAQPCTPCTCYGGLGSIGKWRQFTISDGTSLDASFSWDFFWNNYVVDHELGHNFGVHHANKFACVDPQGNPSHYSLSCASWEYGDQFSVMGSGTLDSGEPEHHNAPHRSEMGWLSDDNVITAQNGEHILTALELPPQSRTDVKMIRIPLAYETNHYIGVDDVYLTLELRQGRGVLVHYAALRDDGDFTYAQSNIARVGLSGDIYEKSNYLLVPGQRFVDEFNGYEITVLELTGDTARVNIQQITQRVVDFSSMLVHYTFDDGTAIDSGSHGLHGEIFGDIKPVADALLFDGGQSILVPSFSAAAIDTQDQLTVSFWLYPHDLQQFRHIVGGSVFQIYQADNQITFRAYFKDSDSNSDNDYFEWTGPIDPFTWSHVVLTYDNNEFAVYINGIESVSAFPFEKDFRTNWLRQYIAGFGGDDGFSGIMDDFKLYSRGLSEYEVQQLYTEFTPQHVPQCADGIDNDGDNRIDYPGDRGCEDQNDNDEVNPSTIQDGTCKVIGGYDFVNNDDDPMDDHGHGTHVAATAAGKSQDFAAEQQSTFSFSIQNPLAGTGYDAVYITAELEKGVATIPYLMSTDGSDFTHFGDRILPSGKSNLALNPGEAGNVITVAAGQIFIASDGNTRKSYPLVVNAVSDTTVTIEDEFAGVTYTLGITDTFGIDDVEIKLLGITNGDAQLTISDYGTFNRLYDEHGFEIDLTYGGLPDDSIPVRILDANGVDKERHEFEWDNGAIEYIQKYYYISTGTGLNGVAPDAQIVAYKVLDAGGFGFWDDIIASIEQSVVDDVDVISLSLTGPGNPDDPVSQAIDNAVDSGVIAVVAAGNDGPSERTVGSPGTARKAITVGAVDKGKNIAQFSSRGPVVWDGGIINKPDVVAPGVAICAAQFENWLDNRRCLDEQHISIQGTSMATPHVSGIAALLKQKHPGWNPADIKSVIKNSAENLFLQSHVQGNGFVDAVDAVNSVPLIAEMEAGKINSDGTIDLKGTAAGAGFTGYVISYQTKDGVVELVRSSTFVTNGFLASLDTYQLPEGNVEVTLHVFGSSTAISTLVIPIDNIQLTLGETLGYLSGAATLTGKVAFSYDSFEVYYQSEGTAQTLLCSGSPQTELCTIDVSNLANGVYYFQFIVSRDGKQIADTETKGVVLNELLPNWPQEIFGFTRGVPLLVDKQLVVPHYFSCTASTSSEGLVQAESSSFTTFQSTSVKTMQGDYFEHSIGLDAAMMQSAGIQMSCQDSSYHVYDASGNNYKVSYLTGNDGSSLVPHDAFPTKYESDAGNLLALSSDYFSKNFAPSIVNLQGVYGNRWNTISGRTFAIMDLNNDNQDELLSVLVDFNAETNRQFISINAFNRDGTVFSQFPAVVNAPKEHFAVLNFPVLMNNQGAPVVSTLSAAFDAGSYRDSFAPTDFALQLNMFDHNGAHIADIPLLDTGDLFVEPVLSLPVISDFDGDGSDEAIIGFSYADLDRFYANNVDPGAFITYVFKVDSLGQSRIIYSTTGHTLRKLAVNIHDGNPVVTMGFWDTFATYETGNKLVSITANGDLVFDIPLNDRDILLSGIVSGDVDGDGSDEIVINYRPRWFNEENSGVQIFSSSGELERDIALPTLGAVDDFFGMPPILEDFNSDGILDIILQTDHLLKDYSALNTRLYALSLGSPVSAELTWPQFMQNPQHTGRFEQSCTKQPFYGDRDGDGFGFLSDKVESCTQPAGYVSDSRDCNDALASINPNAGEVCDNADNNCNAQIDEGIVKPIFYVDSDRDSYGIASSSVQACTLPAGYATRAGDCNDGYSTVNPGAPEICDYVSRDDNCDGRTNENNVCAPYTFQSPTHRIGTTTTSYRIYPDTTTYRQWCGEKGFRYQTISGGTSFVSNTAKYNPTTWVRQRGSVRPPNIIYCVP